MKKNMVLSLLLATCMCTLPMQSRVFAVTEVNVSTYEDLKKEAADESKTKIVVTKDIDISNTILINGDKEIVAKDNQVTIKAIGKTIEKKPMFNISSKVDKVNFSDLKFEGNKIAEGIFLKEKNKSIEMKVNNCDFNNLAGTAINLSKVDNRKDAVGMAKLDLINSDFLSNTNNDNEETSALVATMADNPIVNIKKCKFEDNIFNNSMSVVRVSSNPTDEFKVKNEGALKVEESEFKNNSNKSSSGAGAIVANHSEVELLNTNFIGNSSKGEGGAVKASSVNKDKNLKIIIKGNEFLNNKVTEDSYGNSEGGGLYIEGMDSEISDTIFEKNNSEFESNNGDNKGKLSEGGAIYYTSENSAKKTIHNLKESTFIENSSKETGGAIQLRGINELNVLNTTFDKNHTDGSGGAFFYFSAINPSVNSKDSPTKIKFENTNIKNNTAAYGAGVFYENEGELLSEIIDSDFNNNRADEIGGGFYLKTYVVEGIKVTSSNIEIKNSNLINNESNFAGAIYGIFIGENEKIGQQNINISASNFEKNKGNFGGAIAYDSGMSSSISETKFNDNIATYDGGAFYLRMDKDLNIEGSEFNRNIAEKGRGGAINVLTDTNNKITEDKDVTLYKHIKAKNTKFNDNKAGTGVFEASKEKYPEINKLYRSNFIDIKSLSKPAKINKNIAYNNYDVSLLSNKEIEEVPDGGGSGGGGSGGGSTDDKKTTAILANGKKYTDVLTATVLANEKNCPILLTETDSISKETMDELNRRGVGKLIISGGEKSVSKKVVDKLSDFDVVRYSGNNRYETAREIAKQVRLESGNRKEALLVDGRNFPDVITISALASQKRAPILLTESNELNNITENVLRDWEINKVTIGGQTKSVSIDVENKVKKISNDVIRIGGHDRYKTASLIGKEVRNITGNKEDMILVDGTDFPDGITVNSLAAKYKCPIHLTNSNTLTNITKEDISDWNIENILVAGGINSVSDNIYNNLDVKNKERIAGSNRYMTAVEISKRLDKYKSPIGKLN